MNDLIGLKVLMILLATERKKYIRQALTNPATITLLPLKDLVIGDTFDLIIVIIDKLIKYTIIIPFKEIYKAD